MLFSQLLLQQACQGHAGNYQVIYEVGVHLQGSDVDGEELGAGIWVL
jgi:hypothetical protein